MKVVLLQDVKKLGKRGDVIEVSSGYGRNVLIRQGLAVEGTKANLNTAHQRQESKEFKSQVAADEAEIMASQLKKVKLARDISEALKQQYKFDFDKKKIMLDQPIKAVGEYDVDLWVHPKVKGTIHVSVVAE